ncbi:MAG: hypothetical protein AAGK23_10785 [Pseudomonadota bacterium]
MKFQIASAALGAVLLGGCVIIDADDADFTSDWDSKSGFGTVFAADVAGDTISFTVSDNGCTDRGFFDLRVFSEDEDEFEVGLKRTRQDYCKVYNPEGATVTWSFQEVGIPNGAEVTVLNRVRR